VASYAIVSLLFGDVSGLSAVLLDNANSLNNLHYQRDMEREADCKGVDFLKSQGIDPQGMVLLLERLKTQGDMPKAFTWLSTHPDIDNRIAYTKEYIARSSYKPRPNDSLNAAWLQVRKGR
jgi:predicted Zn-dependent protease